MCGISGFCDFSLNYYDKKPFWETILVQMHETLKHRGPDQAMIDLQPHVGLSHARLSIRDLKSGIQPMTRTFHGKPVPLFTMEKFIITGNCCPNCSKPDIALPQHPTRKSFCALICILEKILSKN